MPNNGFQFKQFFIAHDQCAMKVGTDSIVLGSWVEFHQGLFSGEARSNADQDDGNRVINLLDIGTGSGLLAVMMAQKIAEYSQTHQVDILPYIQAIEPDEAALLQARENMAASLWKDWFQLHHGRIQDIAFQPASMDLIVCNPPYFQSQQMSQNDINAERFSQQRRMARHQDSLSLHELVNQVALLLKPSGEFYCVLPYEQAEDFIQILAEHSLHIKSRLSVKATSMKPVKRIIWRVVKEPPTDEVQELELVIHDASGGYSDDYIKLCRAFYVNF
ncbi:methyltransferase [Paraneptunicella aestuarii]|uniref:tRNA1(Val) (adenine(37)-N6)-methyltransferase n=1 Tax=Paraneptunicella aestuarii TaxID=2831148 RepID=UPI001E4D2EFB|nr:methyltransferase [Paraneptunicella aestuarii]UAA39586.1 methyltransferase [Paraneptunicella aestuarii]